MRMRQDPGACATDADQSTPWRVPTEFVLPPASIRPRSMQVRCCRPPQSGISEPRLSTHVHTTHVRVIHTL